MAELGPLCSCGGEGREPSYDELLTEVEHLRRSVELLRDSAPKEWAIRVDDERRALAAERDWLIARAEADRRKKARMRAELGQLRAQLEQERVQHAEELSTRLTYCAPDPP